MALMTITNLTFYFARIPILILVLFSSCKETKKRGKEKVEINRTQADSFLELANKQIDSFNYDSGIVLLDDALQHSSSIKTEAECFAAKGYCYHKKEEYIASLENYLEATGRFESVKDSIRLAQMWMNMATSYKIIGKYDEAVKNAFQSINILSKDTLHLKEVAMLYNLLGNIDKDMGSFNTAKHYHLKSLKIRKSISKFSTAASINNIGNIFYKQGIYDSALMFYENYRQLSIKFNNGEKRGRAYYNISRTYLKLGNLLNCKLFLDSALLFYEKANFKEGLMSLNLLRSKFYRHSDLNRSEKEALIALEKCNSLHLQLNKLYAIESLIWINIKKNNPARAMGYYLNLKALQDSLERASKLNKLYSYELYSNLETKNKEMKDIEAKRVQSVQAGKVKTAQRNFLIVLFLLAIGLLYHFYAKYLEKHRFVQEYFASEDGVVLRSGMKLNFRLIERIETRRNDLILIVKGKEIIERNTTLKEFVPNLPKIFFGRPQRGIVLNFHYARNVLKTKLDFQGRSINISMKYRNEFLASWNAFQKVQKGK